MTDVTMCMVSSSLHSRNAQSARVEASYKQRMWKIADLASVTGLQACIVYISSH